MVRLIGGEIVFIILSLFMMVWCPLCLVGCNGQITKTPHLWRGDTNIHVFYRYRHTLAEQFIIMWHSHYLYRRPRSPAQQWCWFITWAQVHYPWRLWQCLLSSGRSHMSASPIKLVVYNTGLFKGLTREANVSGNSFHGDLFHRKWISFLKLAWPEFILE